jgi:CBS domain containing-hemolysin-like protein
MEIGRLNERFPWRLPIGEYETVAGLVLAHLGRIPRVGEQLRLDAVTVQITRADARAVREVIVRPLSAE